MNIFYLHKDPEVCARYHADKHVVKMIVETAQLLSTAQRLCGNNSELLYQSTHEDHPSSVWVRSSKANYEYAYKLLLWLLKEYKHRYGRDKYKNIYAMLDELSKVPSKIVAQGIELTPVRLAMPDIYKSPDPVQAYRHYYKKEKAHLLKWTKRQEPYWMQF